jgi:CRISPR-associated endonuclease/helicase Cas3
MVMTVDRLLAKSQNKGEPWHNSMALSVHLADVLAAAHEVLEATGDDQLHAFGLPVQAYRERLRRIVLLAAAVHDLGKANDQFQGMIRGLRDVHIRPQGIRHEWVTLLMLLSLRKWLLPALDGSELDFTLIEWAVTGHHPAHGHASPPTCSPDGSGPEIELLSGHMDFRTILSWLAKTFACAEPPALENSRRSLCGSQSVFAEIARWFRQSQQRWDQIRKLPDAHLVAAAKNALIAADVAGSDTLSGRPMSSRAPAVPSLGRLCRAVMP